MPPPPLSSQSPPSLHDERAQPHLEPHAQRLRSAHLLRRSFPSRTLQPSMPRASASSPQSHAGHTSQQFPSVHASAPASPPPPRDEALTVSVDRCTLRLLSQRTTFRATL
ncbi:hypothetical protein B0H13DRAFT_2337572 [Mycena leptocephala]|nr:hypothetical protein B0H13DRAFT_2337572 [Mycena leptocephala]